MTSASRSRGCQGAKQVHNERDEAWMDSVQTACGEDLRRLIHLHEDGRAVLFRRDDVEPGAADRVAHVFQTLVREMDADSAADPDDHGSLLCVTRRFEETVELYFPFPPSEGVALTLDGHAHEWTDDLIPYLRQKLDAAG